MNATGAVVFLPREGNGPSLMMEELLFDPAALWLAESLRAAGVERFFVVCHTPCCSSCYYRLSKYIQQTVC